MEREREELARGPTDGDIAEEDKEADLYQAEADAEERKKEL